MLGINFYSEGSGTGCPEKLQIPASLEAFEHRLDGDPGQPDLAVGNPAHGKGLEVDNL